MEEKVLMEAKGLNGQLQLLETKVRITRKGFWAFSYQGLKGDKEINIKNISSIQFKRAGKIGTGYIQFTFFGGQETKGGVWNAYHDENTVVFDTKHQSAFEKIKEIVDEKMSSKEKGETKISDLNQLEKLAELKEKGIITEEEFNAKKKQILGL